MPSIYTLSILFPELFPQRTASTNRPNKRKANVKSSADGKPDFKKKKSNFALSSSDSRDNKSGKKTAASRGSSSDRKNKVDKNNKFDKSNKFDKKKGETPDNKKTKKAPLTTADKMRRSKLRKEARQLAKRHGKRANKPRAR